MKVKLTHLIVQFLLYLYSSFSLFQTGTVFSTCKGINRQASVNEQSRVYNKGTSITTSFRYNKHTNICPPLKKKLKFDEYLMNVNENSRPNMNTAKLQTKGKKFTLLKKVYKRPYKNINRIN